MSFYEYWIGKSIDFEGLWDDFENGQCYIEKYKTMRVHLLRLTFNRYTPDLPLFNHEAIFKTVKGTFHDLKRDCLPRNEYESFGPLFLYEASRGSELCLFLAELKPLLLYGSALVSAVYTYQKITQKSLENTEKKLFILKTYFPSASDLDAQAFMKAVTPMGRNKVLKKLIEQGLHKIEVSKNPFLGNIEQTKKEMIELNEALKEK